MLSHTEVRLYSNGPVRKIGSFIGLGTYVQKVAHVVFVYLLGRGGSIGLFEAITSDILLTLMFLLPYLHRSIFMKLLALYGSITSYVSVLYDASVNFLETTCFEWLY